MAESRMQLSINTLQAEVTALRFLIEDVKKRTDQHEKILVVGYEDHLPLAEVVRNLTKTVSDYIGQKDKEEQKRKEQWDKLKWVVIPMVVASAFALIAQAFIFYVKVYPMIEKLSQ